MKSKSILGDVEIATTQKDQIVFLPGDRMSGDVFLKLPKPIGHAFQCHVQLMGTAVYTGLTLDEKSGQLKSPRALKSPGRSKKSRSKKGVDSGDIPVINRKVYAGSTYKSRSGDDQARSFHWFYDFNVPDDAIPSVNGTWASSTGDGQSATVSYELFVWLDVEERGLNNPPDRDDIRCSSRSIPIYVGHKCEKTLAQEKGQVEETGAKAFKGLHVTLSVENVVHLMPSMVKMIIDIDNGSSKEVETSRFALWECRKFGSQEVVRHKVLMDHPKQETWVAKKSAHKFREQFEVVVPHGSEVGGVQNAYYHSPGVLELWHELVVSVFLQKNRKKPMPLSIPLKILKPVNYKATKLWKL